MSNDKKLTPQELIKRLVKLTGPDRSVDGEIGKLIGYVRRVKTDVDPASGKQLRLTVWESPGGDEVKIPAFTKLMQEAYSFVQAVVPDDIGGASWDETGGAARVAGGPYVTAANPAIAMCIAALGEMGRDDAGDDDDDDDDGGQGDF